MNKRKSYKHYQEQLNNTKTCFLSQNLQKTANIFIFTGSSFHGSNKLSKEAYRKFVIC